MVLGYWEFQKVVPPKVSPPSPCPPMDLSIHTSSDHSDHLLADRSLSLSSSFRRSSLFVLLLLGPSSSVFGWWWSPLPNSQKVLLPRPRRAAYHCISPSSQLKRRKSSLCKSSSHHHLLLHFLRYSSIIIIPRFCHLGQAGVITPLMWPIIPSIGGGQRSHHFSFLLQLPISFTHQFLLTSDQIWSLSFSGRKKPTI